MELPKRSHCQPVAEPGFKPKLRSPHPVSMPHLADDLTLNIPHLSPGSTNETHFCFIQEKKISLVQSLQHTPTIVHSLSSTSYLSATMGICVKTQYLLCRGSSLPDVCSMTATTVPWFTNPGLLTGRNALLFGATSVLLWLH